MAMTKTAGLPDLPEYTTWKQALPYSGIVAVFGAQGSGKTATIYDLVETARKWWPSRKVVALYPEYADLKQLRRLLPKKRTRVEFITDLKDIVNYPGAIFVGDELARHVHARDAMSTINKDFVKLSALTRQLDLLSLMGYQHSKQMDLGLITEASLIIMKQPSILHIRMARAEIQDEVFQAWERFVKVSTTPDGKPSKAQRYDPRRYAYVVNYKSGQQGFLPTKLPSFWTEKLSTVFADWEVHRELGVAA